jgi:CHASE2 domain-containing sensor protein
VRALLEFRLSGAEPLQDLLHELNLHDRVVARVQDEREDAPVVVVALDDRSESVWAVRSTVTLFDPDAVELRPGADR